MAGSSSDVRMDSALDSGGSGTPQHFNLSSPRSQDVGNGGDGARRTLRQVESDPEVFRRRKSVEDGETQVLWLAGSPRSVSPRTAVDYGTMPKSPRTSTRTSPTTVARGMLSPPVLRDLSDDAAVALSGSGGSGHNLKRLDEQVSGGGVGFANQSTPEDPPSNGGQGTGGGARGDDGTKRTRQSRRCLRSSNKTIGNVSAEIY